MVQRDVRCGSAGGEEDEAVRVRVAPGVALVATGGEFTGGSEDDLGCLHGKTGSHVVLLLDDVAHRRGVGQLEIDELSQEVHLEEGRHG